VACEVKIRQDLLKDWYWHCHTCGYGGELKLERQQAVDDGGEHVRKFDGSDCCMKGLDACDGEVTFGPDPFNFDIHDDSETMWWMCTGHARERALEV
jgi:hypothetical protein